MELRIQRFRFVLFAIVLVYVSALLALTIFLRSPLYTAYMYDIGSFGLADVILGVIFAMIPAAWIPMQLGRPSHIVYWFLYLIVYIPTTLLLHAPGTVTIDTILFLVTLCVSFYLVFRFTTARRLQLSDFKHERAFKLALFGLWTGCVGVLVAFLGPDLSVATYHEIYAVRESYKASLAEMGPIVRRLVIYSLSALRYAIGPIFIVMFLERQSTGSIPYLIIGVFSISLGYLIGGFKSSIFVLVAIFGLFVLLKSPAVFSKATLISFISLITVSWSIYAIGGLRHFLALTRRVLLAAGVGSAAYVDFFSSNPHTYFSGRFFMPFLEYPYGVAPPRLIGDHYFGGGNININSFAEGYMELGLLGVILLAVLLGIVLWIYDSATVQMPLMYSIPMISGYLTVLAYTDIITSIYTHGLLWLLLLAIIKPPFQGTDRGVEQTIS